jgi:hypothetical protein
MNIQINQIWSRKKYTDNPIYYPKKGWKVRIMRFDGKVVTHQICEYDGKPTSAYKSEPVQHSLDEFLHMYELK